jgi:hypothetical protein
MDGKIRRVLKKYGQVVNENGLFVVKNKGKHSFHVEIIEKQVKVSPCFGPGVKPAEWSRIAEKEALVIQKAVLKIV